MDWRSSFSNTADESMPDDWTLSLSLRKLSFSVPAESVENRTIVDLDVYFARDFITKYKTILVFTWVDLIVSFGGTTGLFLGCSLISLVELVYFFVVPRPIREKQGQPHQLRRRPSRVEQTQIKLREYQDVYWAQQKL